MTQSTKKSKAKPVLMSSDDYILLFCAFRHDLYQKQQSKKTAAAFRPIMTYLIAAYDVITSDQRSMFVKEIDEYLATKTTKTGCDKEWDKVRDLYTGKSKKIKSDRPPRVIDLKKQIGVIYSACNYALGRHTYVVGSIVKLLINSYSWLTQDQRDTFVKKIDEYYAKWPKEKEGVFDYDYNDWIKVRDLYDPEHRVMVKAYWPIHKQSIGKDGTKINTSTINKKKKPKVERAVWSAKKYWNPNMTSSFVFPQEIKGRSWS